MFLSYNADVFPVSSKLPQQPILGLKNQQFPSISGCSELQSLGGFPLGIAPTLLAD